MAKKARLSLYLEDEEFKKQVKVAAAKRGLAITDYCAEAIEQHLIRDGERSIAESKSRNAHKERLNLLAGIEKLRQNRGPISVLTSELVEFGRHGRSYATRVKTNSCRCVCSPEMAAR